MAEYLIYIWLAVDWLCRCWEWRSSKKKYRSKT